MQTACVTAVILTICFHKFIMAWDWCSEEAKCEIDKEKVPNTMCTMKAEPENTEYKGIKEVTTDEFRKDMVRWHNTYRDKMANGEIPGWPKAADMRQLTYDKDLETVALRWSFQTRRGHDKCRRTEAFPVVGQNCGMLWSGVTDPLRPVNLAFLGWVDEILLTDPSIVDKFKFEAKWGHFSNVVWAKTYKIGCATTSFLPKPGAAPKPEKVETFAGRHVACNLAPAGNFIDDKMYTRGEPCSACPSGTQCNPKSTYPHLCAVKGDPADEVPEFLGKLPSHGEMVMVDYYSAFVILFIIPRFL